MIETKRLLLREFMEADYDDLLLITGSAAQIVIKRT